MGHQPGRRPAATGVGAVAGLQPRCQGAESHVRAEADVPALAPVALRLDVSGRAPEHGLDHHPVAGCDGAAVVVVAVGGGHGDDFVAGHEGEADQVLEVARAAAVEGREVGSTDAREQRPQREPFGAGQVGRIAVEETEGTNPGPAARAQRRDDP